MCGQGTGRAGTESIAASENNGGPGTGGVWMRSRVVQHVGCQDVVVRHAGCEDGVVRHVGSWCCYALAAAVFELEPEEGIMYSGDVAEAHVPGALPGLVLPSTGPVTTVDTASTAGTGTAAAVTELITGPAAADADTAATTAAAGTTPPPAQGAPGAVG